MYDSFKDLHKGKYDWKVAARVMNLWRGFTKSGEPFKGFNLLLVDNKRSRIHAFVPANIAGIVEPVLEVGRLYLFKNFTVKEYKPEDKFRCVVNDIFIIFTKDTKVCDLDEKDICIERAVYDFYDLGDLKNLSTESTYLTDVIGVIQDTEIPLSKFTNKHNQPQSQVKFNISDGKTTVKVTFWDAFAELFDEMVTDDFERPLIIIVGCGRVTEWNDKIDISNVGATTFQVNGNHHSVNQMRNMLKLPQFATLQAGKRVMDVPKLLTIKELTEVGEDYIQKFVYCQVTIQTVKQTDKWFTKNCTSCYKPTSIADNLNYCSCGPRIVSYPLKWFDVSVVAIDEIGEIDIILKNPAGQKCYGKDVFDIVEKKEDKLFPEILKSIEKENFMMKLLIKKENIVFKSRVYIAEDIISGELATFVEESHPKPLEESFAEASTSSCHIEDLSMTS